MIIFKTTQLLLHPADNYSVTTLYIFILKGENDVSHVRAWSCLILCIAAMSWAPAVYAGVFESIHPQTGKPLRWLDPNNIPYSVDQGGLGKLSHDEAVGLLEEMMRVWENEGGGAIHFVSKGTLAEDVGQANMGKYLDTSVCADNIPPKIASMIAGESPIIFDNDGSIIEALSGPGSSKKIVGKAAFRCFKGTLANPEGVTQAFLVMNGLFIDGKADPVDLPINVYAGVMLHELGHFLGLHHSMVNEEIYHDVLAGLRTASDAQYVPVMYPLILTNSKAATVLKPDDMSILRELYPVPTYASTQLIGKVLTHDGQQVRGANVVARRQDDPLCQAVAAISGRECTAVMDKGGNLNLLSDSCSNPNMQGDYVVRGLSTGNYSVEVSEIVSDGGARNNMFPKSAGIDLPGEPGVYVANVAVTAGQLVRDLDLHLAPVAIPHHTSVSIENLPRATNSDCKPDPVDYSVMISDGTAGVALPTSSASGSANAALPSGGGCALQRDHQLEAVQSLSLLLLLPLPLLAIRRQRLTRMSIQK